MYKIRYGLQYLSSPSWWWGRGEREDSEEGARTRTRKTGVPVALPLGNLQCTDC